MGYYYTSAKVVAGELQITPAGIARFGREVKERPDGFEDMIADPSGYLDGFRVRSIPSGDECSGDDYLREFLRRCDGEARVLVCWEGGDSYSGLIVKDGRVTEGRVVHTVVPFEEEGEDASED